MRWRAALLVVLAAFAAALGATTTGAADTAGPGFVAVPAFAGVLPHYAPAGVDVRPGSESALAAKGGSELVEETARNIRTWVGDDARLIRNDAGDTILISRNGTRRVRFDVNRPHPHQSPHSHVEALVNGKWKKSGPIYPVDVPKG